MLLRDLGVLATAAATIVTQLVFYYQLRQQVRRQGQETHAKLSQTQATVEQVHRDVNGRVDQLLHEARKAAALEAVTPSDAPEP